MGYEVLNIIAYFFIYSFVGWCVEVIYQGVEKGKLVNRGFLNGPVCPIYGFGMVSVVLLLTPIKGNLLLLFLGGIFITTAIELFGGWALDKLFHMRWWDYTDKPLNLNGYICMEFCLFWGIGVVGIMRIIHPIVEETVDKIPVVFMYIALIVLAVYMIADTIVTYKTVIGITRELRELERIAATMKEISDALANKVGTTAIAANEKAEESKEKIEEAFAEGREKLETSITEHKDKIENAITEHKDKLETVITEGRDKLEGVIADGKDKIEGAITEGKDKFENALTESINRIEEAKAENRTKLQAKMEELELQKIELEKHYKVVLDKLQNHTGRYIKAFPNWHKSGENTKIREFQETLKKVLKIEEEKQLDNK